MQCFWVSKICEENFLVGTTGRKNILIKKNYNVRSIGMLPLTQSISELDPFSHDKHKDARDASELDVAVEATRLP